MVTNQAKCECAKFKYRFFAKMTLKKKTILPDQFRHAGSNGAIPKAIRSKMKKLLTLKVVFYGSFVKNLVLTEKRAVRKTKQGNEFWFVVTPRERFREHAWRRINSNGWCGAKLFKFSARKNDRRPKNGQKWPKNRSKIENFEKTRRALETKN